MGRHQSLPNPRRNLRQLVHDLRGIVAGAFALALFAGLMGFVFAGVFVYGAC